MKQSTHGPDAAVVVVLVVDVDVLVLVVEVLVEVDVLVDVELVLLVDDVEVLEVLLVELVVVVACTGGKQPSQRSCTATGDGGTNAAPWHSGAMPASRW